jgi:2-phospho-L-lactate guanylyltransferase
MQWILPVKDVSRGKSRLHVPGVPRDELLLAMLRDTLEAVLGSATGDVCVVSPDARVQALANECGVPYLGHDGGLNLAIAAACRTDGVNAALLPDLPCVRAEELSAVIARNHRGFVPDATGRGTTLAFDRGLVPRFGAGSAEAFRAAGLPRIDGGPGLRRDVDTAADLRAAQALGLGRHTAAVLARAKGRPDARTGPSRVN